MVTQIKNHITSLEESLSERLKQEWLPTNEKINQSIYSDGIGSTQRGFITFRQKLNAIENDLALAECPET